MRERRELIIFLLVLSFAVFLALVAFNAMHTRDSPIDVNSASAQALESLPGIGPTLAERIIADRPYSDVYDLLRVKGIGDKTLTKIKGKVVAQ